MDAFNIIVRMSSRDAHYGGGIVAGARILELFGDAATGLTAVADANEGLLQSWENVEFVQPVHPGDFIQVEAKVVKKTRMRRFIDVAAFRLVRGLSSADALVEKVEPPERIASAKGVMVIPYSQARAGAKHE